MEKEVYFTEDHKIKKGIIKELPTLIYRWERKYISYDEDREQERQWAIKRLKRTITEEKKDLVNLKKRQNTEYKKQSKKLDELNEKLDILNKE